ncbi:MAG TPA: fructose 1,6-bisphosphatase, partial [Solirubrobacteraceae bacterium]
MSVVTISAIKADVGGVAGRSAVHPELIAAATQRVREAIGDGLLIDGAVNACGDDVNLVMTHRHAVDAEPVHRSAWETFEALTEIARRLHLYGAGQDLLADAFSGNVRGAGPGVVHDLIEHRRILFQCPQDLYDLLVFIGTPSRYVIKHVFRHDQLEEPVASTSTSRLSLIAGRYVGKDDPIMIVRLPERPACGGRGPRAVRQAAPRGGVDARLAQ